MKSLEFEQSKSLESETPGKSLEFVTSYGVEGQWKELPKDYEPQQPELWGEKTPPLWQRLLEYATLHHVEAPRTSAKYEAAQKEVEYNPATGEFDIRTPTTAAKDFLSEDPLGLPLVMAAAPLVKFTQPLAKRLGTAALEYFGEATGGVTDIPRLVKPAGQALARRVIKESGVPTESKVIQTEFKKQFQAKPSEIDPVRLDIEKPKPRKLEKLDENNVLYSGLPIDRMFRLYEKGGTFVWEKGNKALTMLY